MRRVPLALLVAAAITLAPPELTAQDRPRPVFIARLDGTSSAAPRLEASLGAAIPLGTYARLHVTAGGGAARDAGVVQPAARADIVGRFLLDPLKQARRGLYFGGGVSFLTQRGSRGRAWLTFVAGMEVAEWGGTVPGIELGVGGGARLGLVMRRAMPNWR